MMKNKRGHRQITLFMPVKLHKKFKIQLAKDEKRLSEVVRNLVESYADKKLDCQGQAK